MSYVYDIARKAGFYLLMAVIWTCVFVMTVCALHAINRKPIELPAAIILPLCPETAGGPWSACHTVFHQQDT